MEKIYLSITKDEEDVLVEMIKYFNDMGWINDSTQKEYDSLSNKICDMKDEDNLKISNSPTNGQFLSAQSGNTGGMTWAVVDALPSQSGHSGKFLTTDATDASWAVLNTDSNTTTKSLYEMANAIASNYTIATNYNAVSAGPITVNNGVSVTVPSGSTWVIV